MTDRDHEAPRPDDRREDDPDPRSTRLMSPHILDLPAEENGQNAADEAAQARSAEAAQEDEAKRRHREASRRGGLKGGRARAAKLSAERRSEIARAAARARWAKRRRDSA